MNKSRVLLVIGAMAIGGGVFSTGASASEDFDRDMQKMASGSKKISDLMVKTGDCSLDQANLKEADQLLDTQLDDAARIVSVLHQRALSINALLGEKDKVVVASIVNEAVRVPRTKAGKFFSYIVGDKVVCKVGDAIGIDYTQPVNAPESEDK